MGCGTCGSGACTSAGCGQNGGCATGGCNKLNTYDWLGNMLSPDKTEVDNIYEVRFKNTRKSFYRNVNGLRLYIGDTVVVESDRGYDLGTLSLGGVMAELQIRKKKLKTPVSELPRIYRKANEADKELYQQAKEREQATMVRGREIIQELNLEMKLSDVEFQADNAKATFYYIADHRVDFRELIKVLAREFRIRVEMKQIGLRHEAGLVGGIGSCGRELCCASWLTDFKTVSTSAARYQNLSLNPMKISGLCGRLKCCLNYELDTYLEALDNFPKIDRIETRKGMALLQKTDIFKGMMWFSYRDETSWYAMDVEEVKEIAEMNERGEMPDALKKHLDPGLGLEERDQPLDFVDVVGTALPPPEPRKRRKSRKLRNNRNNRGRGKGQGHHKGNDGQQKRNQGSRKPKEGNASSEDQQSKQNRSGRGRNSRRGGGRGNRGRGGRPPRNQPPKDQNPDDK